MKRVRECGVLMNDAVDYLKKMNYLNRTNEVNELNKLRQKRQLWSVYEEDVKMFNKRKNELRNGVNE